MSATTHTDYEDLRRYLLGRLPEEEAQPLLARLLADPELFELAEATEAEILDEHFRGELAAADCQGLLDRLAASPAGRRRIALAQGLAAVTTRAATWPEAAPVLPFRPRLLARPAARVALAAALVGAAVAVWQVQPGLPTRPAKTTRQQVAVDRQPLPPLHSTSAEVSPFLFNLSLITLRGGEESLPDLVIPPEKTVVELRLHLSPEETFPAYDLSLKREGEIVWERPHVAPPGGLGAPLAVRLPASVLAAGMYELEVRGVAPDGNTELLGTPSFRRTLKKSG
jgi:hypothetical protein